MSVGVPNKRVWAMDTRRWEDGAWITTADRQLYGICANCNEVGKNVSLVDCGPFGPRVLCGDCENG